MELWFTEEHSPNVRFSVKVNRQLYSQRSEFQKIDIYETPEFGRVLVIDGYIMATEKDEFAYHEMIAHVPMAVNTEAKRVLVVGGGDGGTVRELVKYPFIERIDMVEIDKLVVDACRQYLPQTACRLDEARVNLYFEDGVKFVSGKKGEYDLIIVDSTDPIGPGEGLFTAGFYRDCFEALNEGGILVNQHESPFYEDSKSFMMRAHKRIREIFPICRVYQVHVPTYPSGHWLFGFASKRFDPVADLDADRWNALGIQAKYYNTDIHRGSFALPGYVLGLLKNC